MNGTIFMFLQSFVCLFPWQFGKELSLEKVKLFSLQFLPLNSNFIDETKIKVQSPKKLLLHLLEEKKKTHFLLSLCTRWMSVGRWVGHYLISAGQTLLNVDEREAGRKRDIDRERKKGSISFCCNFNGTAAQHASCKRSFWLVR